MQSQARPEIATADLVRRFGDFEAVRGVSFEVQAGETFGFLGPNGVGKTTTIRMLCTLLHGHCFPLALDFAFLAAFAVLMTVIGVGAFTRPD